MPNCWSLFIKCQQYIRHYMSKKLNHHWHPQGGESGLERRGATGSPAAVLSGTRTLVAVTESVCCACAVCAAPGWDVHREGHSCPWELWVRLCLAVGPVLVGWEQPHSPLGCFSRVSGGQQVGLLRHLPVANIDFEVSCFNSDTFVEFVVLFYNMYLIGFSVCIW